MKWFRHDSSAHRDIKLKRLKRKHGIVGYGLYWYCLELIAGNVDKKNITFQLEDDAEEIALEWELDRVTVSEMMAFMVELNLFESNDNRISCLKMAHRLDDTNSRNPQIHALIKSLNSNETLIETPETLREIPKQLRKSPTRLDKTRLDKKQKITSEPAVADNRVITKNQQEKIIALYHQHLPELSKVMVSRWHGSKHAKALASRWREDDKFRNGEFWVAFFQTVRSNPWWMGEPDKKTSASWEGCNLAWLVKRENFDKVIDLGMRAGS